MSHAISFSEFGGPGVLRWSEVDDPSPGPGQIAVRVRAASVNPLEAKVRRGELEHQFKTELPAIPGTDAAGVVEALGEGVEGVAVGDEVLGPVVSGSYREIALMERQTPKPSSISWELAASLPMVGETAVRSLAHLGLTEGQTLLILGAAGSVGSVVTQLGVSRGIVVIGAVAPEDQERVEALGGRALPYGDGLAERVRELGVERVDGVLDTAGHGPMEEVLELVASPERVLTLVDFASVARYGIRATGGDPSDRVPEGVDEVAKLAGEGKLDIAIWRTYKMSDAAEAHKDLEDGEAKGKLVLQA